MDMHKCKNCGAKCKYINVQMSLFLGKQQIYCSECGAHHDAKMIFRIVFSILILLPIVFSGYIQRVTPNGATAMKVYVAYIFVVILIIPFLIRYRLVSLGTE